MELNSRATLDLQDWRAGIQQIKADIQSLGNSRDSSVKINITDGGTTQRTKRQIDELALASKRLANEAATIRNRFQANFGQASQGEIQQFRAEMESVRTRALEMADGLEVGDDRLRKLTQTARLATASIEAAEGNVSRLGLASQTAAGIMSTGIINALQQFGPAGQLIAQFIEIFFSNAEKTVQDEGKDVEQTAKKAGQYTAEGFADGLKDTTQIKRAASDMAATATDSIKAELDINSPSRVTYGLGVWVAEGFEQGIRSGKQGVARAVNELASQVPQNLNSTVSFGTVDLGMKSAIPTVNALGNELVDLKRQALEAGLAFNNIPKGINGVNQELADFFGGIGEQSSSLEVAVHGASQAVETTAEVVGAGAEVIDTATESYERVTSATNVWMASLTALGIIVTGLTVNGVRQLGQFEKAINTFSASGETNIKGLEGQIVSLQQNTSRAAQSFSQNELAGALSETIKAGTTSAQAFELLKTSTKLAAAESDNLTDSSGRLLKNLRQFDQGVEQAGRFGNALAKAGKEAAGDVRGLGEGLAVAGTFAKTAGFDLEDVLGVLVELDKKGLDAAQEGATGFRTVLTQLANPSEDAKEAIAGLGVELTDVNGIARPLKEVLYEVRAALVGNAEATQIASKIFGSEGVTAFLGISEASRKMAKDFRDSEGALDEFANQMTEGTVEAAKRFQKALDDVSLGFVKTFRPAATATLEALVDIGKFFGQAANDGTLFVLAATAAGVALTKLNTTILYSPAGVILTQMWTTARTAVTGYIATARTAALLNPAGLAIAGFGALVLILNKVNNLYKELADLQDQLNANTLKSDNALLKKVDQLIKENTALSKLQAKRLLLMDQLNTQVPAGTDFLGNIKYKPAVDGEAKIKLLKDLKDLNAQIQAEQKKAQASIKTTTDQTIKFSAEALDAIGKIGDLKLDLMSPLDREIAQIKGKVEDLIAELKATIKNKGALEIKIREVREIEADLLARARADAAKDAAEKAKQEREAKRREKEQELQDLKSANQQVLELNKEVLDAQIANIQDESQRQAAERARDLKQLQRSIQERVEAVREYPDKVRQVEALGQQQLQALREKWNQKDLKAREDTLRKKLEVARLEQEQTRALQDAQFTAAQQGIEAQLVILAQSYEKQRVAAGTNADALLQVEKRFAAERTRLQLALLKAQEQKQLLELKRQQNDALAQENLTATQRVAIVRRYMQETLNVEASFRGQRQKIIGDGALEILKAEQANETERTRVLQEEKEKRERLAEEEARNRAEAAQKAGDAERQARNAETEAISDPTEKLRKERADQLKDLQDSIDKELEAAKAFPIEAARIRAAGQRQIQALQKKWQLEDERTQRDANEKKLDEEKRLNQERLRLQQEKIEGEQDANKAAEQAQANALTAEIAAIKDENSRREAERSKELRELQKNIQDRVNAVRAYPKAAQAIEEAGQREIQALRQRWANEDLERTAQINQKKQEEEEKRQQAEREAQEKAREEQAKRDEQAAEAQRKLLEEQEKARQELLKLGEDVESGNLDRFQTAERQLVEQRLQALEDYYDYQSELLAGNVEEQTRMERQGLQVITAARLEGLKVSQLRELQSLQESLRKQLSNELLSERQRLSIRQSYAALFAQVEEKYALERLSVERNLITGLNKLDRTRRDALQQQLDQTRDLLDATRELQDTLNGGQAQPVGRQDIQDLTDARDQAIRAARAAIQSGDTNQQVKAFQNLNAVLKQTADLQERISKPSQDLRELQARRAGLLRDLAEAQTNGDTDAQTKLAAEYREVQQEIQQTTKLIQQQQEAATLFDGFGILGRDLRLQNNQIESIRQSLAGLTRDATQTSQTLATQLEAEVGKTLPDTFGKLGLSAGEQFTQQFVQYLNSNLTMPLLTAPQVVGPVAPGAQPTMAQQPVTNNYYLSGGLQFPNIQTTDPRQFVQQLIPELGRWAQQQQRLQGPPGKR